MMQQRRLGPVSPDEMMAYVDGEATPEVAERIAANPQWSEEARGYARVQEALQQRLYRFDCPSSQTLGEYELGMLATVERTRIAQHVVACPHCLAELETLRAFMTVEADLPPVGTIERVRRFVATLVPAPRGAVAGLRGASDAATRVYHAGPFTITLDVAAMRRGRAQIIGLIWREDGDVLPPGSTASLVGASGTVATAEVDDLGNCAFDDVGAGLWQVEVRVGDDIIIIEEIRIGI
jgi:hypothetical protein